MCELAALTDHVPVNPLLVTELSDVNVTLRNPVDELYVALGTCCVCVCVCVCARARTASASAPHRTALPSRTTVHGR